MDKPEPKQDDEPGPGDVAHVYGCGLCNRVDFSRVLWERNCCGQLMPRTGVCIIPCFDGGLSRYE